jgi:hypothetical protein
MFSDSAFPTLSPHCTGAIHINLDMDRVRELLSPLRQIKVSAEATIAWDHEISWLGKQEQNILKRYKAVREAVEDYNELVLNVECDMENIDEVSEDEDEGEEDPDEDEDQEMEECQEEEEQEQES